MTEASDSLPKVYEFTVSLVGSAPRVWRRFLAHEVIHLNELHILIQMVMGWQAKHVFEYRFGDTAYMAPEYSEDTGAKDLEGVTLQQALGSLKKFSYVYDFGDYWNHEIEITKVLDHNPSLIYPVCIGGENACPPEDIGGLEGYANLKKALKGEAVGDAEDLLEQVGGFFDPTTFDPNFVNRYMLWAGGDE